MRHKVAALEWSMGRSCDAPDCGRVVEGRGSIGMKAWLLGHSYCSRECRLEVESPGVRARPARLPPVHGALDLAGLPD